MPVRGAKDGNGFENNPQNINRNGRPKKTVNLINQELQAEGYEKVSNSHITDAYSYLLGLDEDKLLEIKTDIKQPILYRKAAEMILSKDRGFEIVEKMIDRAHGKAIQKTELTGKDGKELEPPTIVIHTTGVQPITSEEHLEKFITEFGKSDNSIQQDNTSI